jgi:hypothetical protein
VDALDLLFRRIVLAAQAAGALQRPLTVLELLDEFAPYGAAKRDGALDTHDDYLHAMMRLVSGEGARFFADDLMQDDLKAELQSPNPDLTVLRTYANTKLRISTSGVAEVLAGDTEIDLSPPPKAGTPRRSGGVPSTGAPRVSGAQPAVRRPTPPPTSAVTEHPTEPRDASALQQVFDAYASSAMTTPPVTTDLGCPYCAQVLPKGRAITFCPSCGQNLNVKRCPGCSAEIESGWKFCVTCGRKA